MKKLLLLLPVIVLSMGFVSCSDDDEELVGNWVKRSDFEGVSRSDAGFFVIDNEAYICCGYDGKDRLTDLWRTDGVQWTQLASMPAEATPRSTCSGFDAAGKGYIGLGYDGDNYLQDFWCYDPSTDSWSQIADYPGGERYGAVSFTLDNIGYVGCGYDGNALKDFYKFSPSTGNWTKISSITGSKRQGASSFVLNGVAYVIGGVNNGTYVNDFFKYDSSSDTWTELRKISDVTDEAYDDDYNIIRSYGSTFTIGNLAYYTCGEAGSIKYDTWEYNPTTDTWEEKTNFEGTSRVAAVGFTINGRGYVTTGRSSTYRFDDMFEFFPMDEYDEYD